MARAPHAVQPFPHLRYATQDVLHASSRKHMIHAMLEVDVTDARRALKARGRERGETPSLTALVIAACAGAVDRHPGAHAYRDLRRQLVLFDQVDVSTTVERLVDGVSQVVPTIIRGANEKSLHRINEELRAAKERPVKGSEVFGSMRAYLLIPPFVRRLVFRILDRMPHAMKRHAGTVMVTSVGMFGRGAGWGIPVASHTLNIAVGGVVNRVRMLDGEPTERDHLCLTVSFDHDIVDGAPAARYLHELRRRIEKGADLVTADS